MCAVFGGADDDLFDAAAARARACWGVRSGAGGFLGVEAELDLLGAVGAVEEFKGQTP